MSEVYFGVDLGTGNCSVAYVTDDPRQRQQQIVDVRTVEVPVGDGETSGSNRVPSVVAGDWRSGARRRPLFGWDFFQTFLQKRRSPALLRRGVDYFTSVKSDMGTNKVYAGSVVPGAKTPAEVTTLILQRLVEMVHAANPRHDLAASRVAFSVPASFSALARQETLTAALAAGFDAGRIELVDEPVAALVDLLNSSDVGTVLTDRFQNVLVFDYGAGTCDLSLVEARFDQDCSTGLEVINRAISPYRKLGGDDVDRAVMEEIVWPQVASGAERESLTPEDRRSLEDTLIPTVARGLKERICRRVEAGFRQTGDWSVATSKLRETYSLDARFMIGSLKRKTPAQFTITAGDFARVMEPFVEVAAAHDSNVGISLLGPVRETLKRGRIRPDQLHVLVLHGGSSRNPYVQQMLMASVGYADLFGSLKIIQTPDAMASVARGAALSAYWRHARGVDVVRPIVAEDLGIVVMGGAAKSLVRAGQTLPYPDDDGVEDVTAGEEEFVIPVDGLPEVLVPVYTGHADAPRIAGTIKVPVPPGTPAGARIRIKLRIDREKTLNWWFSIGGSEFERAESIDDPWTTCAPTAHQKRLLEHRRVMRKCVDRGANIPAEWRIQEALLLRKASAFDEMLVAIEDMERSGCGGASELLNLRGLNLSDRGDSVGALAAFKAAANADSTNAVAVGNAGCQLADLGRRREAVAYLRRALSLNSGLRYIYEYLADVLRADGDEDGAQRELRRAVSLAQKRIDAAPFDPDAWSTMANLRFILGEYELGDAAERAAEELSRNEFYGGDSGAVIATRFGTRTWDKEKV